MSSPVDVRPPALDVLFRPGNTATITLNWSPTGILTGRTFSAELNGTALTTAVDVTGDVMTVVVTDTETGALAVGVPVSFELLEDIGGTDEPVIVGQWTPSNDARAVSSATVEVTSGAATVEVTVQGIGASVGDLTVTGSATFSSSPIVPNPADLDPQAAASIGEVQELIAESSAGFLRSMDPISALFPAVTNSTTETSLLTAPFEVPKATHETVYRFVATGFCRNTSGGPIDFTWRLKNLTDGATMCAITVTLPDDASGTRPWRFVADAEGNTALADGILTVGHLAVGAGASDSLQHALGQAIMPIDADPSDWDVTVQMSAAGVGASVFVFSAQLLYALPGA